MAYKQSLSTRASLLKQKFHPSFSYIIRQNNGKDQPQASDSSQPTINIFLQRGYHNSIRNCALPGLGSRHHERKFLFYTPLGFQCFSHSYSSSTIREEPNKVDCMSDVAEFLSDKGVDVAVSQASVVNEVAVAAADSFFPVAALQYVIDGVHSFTGFNWWASIALVTIMIRGATVPFLINQLKATTKLTLMRPHLEEIKQQMENMAMDPKAVAEGQKRMKEIFKEYGVTPFTPLRGLFIQGPLFVSFYLAITNMVDKVPSFKEGGTFWFTDLTTPDNLYIFPVLTALTFLITVECNMQEGLEGNPVAGKMKNFSRIIGVLAVPFTMSFPKALFCYWVTSNMFSLAYGLVIKRPQVKQFLDIPVIPAPATNVSKSDFSLISTSKPSKIEVQEPPSLPLRSSSNSAERASKASVMSQRLKSLEKQVKSRSKNKKR